MSVQTFSEGMVEVQEIILLQSSHSMSIPANTQEQFESVPHTLKVSPFVKFKVSIDGGKTFYPPIQPLTLNDRAIHIRCFADNNNVYFSYAYGNSPAVNAAFSCVIQYKLFVTESTTA